jgi:hypothetical protein
LDDLLAVVLTPLPVQLSAIRQLLTGEWDDLNHPPFRTEDPGRLWLEGFETGLRLQQAKRENIRTELAIHKHAVWVEVERQKVLAERKVDLNFWQEKYAPPDIRAMQKQLSQERRSALLPWPTNAEPERTEEEEV